MTTTPTRPAGPGAPAASEVPGTSGSPETAGVHALGAVNTPDPRLPGRVVLLQGDAGALPLPDAAAAARDRLARLRADLDRARAVVDDYDRLLLERDRLAWENAALLGAVGVRWRQWWELDASDFPDRERMPGGDR